MCQLGVALQLNYSVPALFGTRLRRMSDANPFPPSEKPIDRA
jgi:hypothetical protein